MALRHKRWECCRCRDRHRLYRGLPIGVTAPFLPGSCPKGAFPPPVLYSTLIPPFRLWVVYVSTQSIEVLFSFLIPFLKSTYHLYTYLASSTLCPGGKSRPGGKEEPSVTGGRSTETYWKIMKRHLKASVFRDAFKAFNSQCQLFGVARPQHNVHQ